MKKRILSLVCATLLCLGQLVVAASAEETAATPSTGTTAGETEDVFDAKDCKFTAWTSDGKGNHTRTCPGVKDNDKHKEHTETEACSGGKATCCTLAVCSICKGTYGTYDATNHLGATEVRGYVAATFDKVGFSGNTHCTGCGAITKAGVMLDKTHFCQFGPWVAGNNGTHTSTCSVAPYNVHTDTMRCKDGDDADALCDICGWDIGKAIAAGTYKETAEGKAVVVTTPKMIAKHRLLRGIVR